MVMVLSSDGVGDMANVFRSKEVLKKAHQENHGDNVVVPVYGVYVSGEYTPPYYVNPTLMFLQVATRKANIDDLTTKTMDYTDHALNILDITFDAICPDIVNYYEDTISLPMDHVLNILDITFDTSFTFESYTSDSFSMTDHALNILDITYDADYTVKDTPDKKLNNTPEPALRIRTIETVKATIK